MDSIPQADTRLPTQVGKQFDQADQKLRKARNNRKARSKIKPQYFQDIRRGKARSVPASQKGVSSQQRARDTFKSNAVARQAASGGLHFNTKVQQMMASTVNGNQSIGGAYASAGFSNAHLVSVSNVKNVDQLASMLSDQKGERAQITQALCETGNRQTAQLQANQGFAKAFKGFAQKELGFANKEKAYGTKEKMFQGICKTLQMVGKALASAAQALQTAAQAVEAAASAVAGIPFVGAALSAALKAVAMVLKAIAKVIKSIGKLMDTMGQKMGALAKKMGNLATRMKAQKLVMQARKVATRAKLDQGLARLKQIQSARSRIVGALGVNDENQQRIAARMAALGRRAKVGSSTGATGPSRSAALGRLTMGALAGGVAALGANLMNRGATPNAPSSAAAPMPVVGPIGGASFGSGGFGGGGFTGGGFGGGGFAGGGPVPAPAADVEVAPPAPPTETQPEAIAPPPRVTTPLRHAVGRTPLRDAARGGPAQSRGLPSGPLHEHHSEHQPQTRQHDKHSHDHKQQQARRKRPRRRGRRGLAGHRGGAAAAARTAAAMGQIGSGQASGKRLEYEQQLRQLTSQVRALRGPEGRGTAHDPRLRSKQDQLVDLYDKIAQQGVEIDGGVESRARGALKGCPRQPNQRIKTTRGGDSVAGRAGAGAGSLGGGIEGGVIGLAASGLNRLSQIINPPGGGGQSGERDESALQINTVA